MDDQLDLFGGASKKATVPIPDETAPAAAPANETVVERGMPQPAQAKKVRARRAVTRSAAAHADDTESAAEPHVVGVAELDRDLKRVLEHATRDLLVEGEVVNLAPGPAGPPRTSSCPR